MSEVWSLAIATYLDPDKRGRSQNLSATVAKLLGPESFAVARTCDLTYNNKLALQEFLARETADLVVICGGTGVGPSDVVPEEVARLADYEIPGIGEKMRRDSERYSDYAAVSRGGAWKLGNRIVAALPGSERAVGECLESIGSLLEKLVRASRGCCGPR